MGIARNRAIDLLRSRPHQARLRERDAVPTTTRAIDAGPDAGNIGLRRAVAEALGELPAAQREAIELAYYRGMTQTEVAQALNQPLGTIKSRTRDGLERLRARLRPLMELPGGMRP